MLARIIETVFLPNTYLMFIKPKDSVTVDFHRPSFNFWNLPKDRNVFELELVLLFLVVSAAQISSYKYTCDK